MCIILTCFINKAWYVVLRYLYSSKLLNYIMSCYDRRLLNVPSTV